MWIRWICNAKLPLSLPAFYLIYYRSYLYLPLLYLREGTSNTTATKIAFMYVQGIKHEFVRACL